MEGYILIFLKALYGLKSSGKRWAEVIHGIYRDMKVLPSKADSCIWLRKAPNLRCYEYIAVYVDDLCIAAEFKSPSPIISIFKTKYHLKVKGDGKLNYHLGADYFEVPDGTFVSQLQGLVTPGKFDLHAQVVIMSRFRAAPRQGHMDRLKKIYSYAIRTKVYAIRCRTDQPDYSFLQDLDFNWTYSIYGDVQEILTDDMPEPLGKAVVTTTTMDAKFELLFSYW